MKNLEQFCKLMQRIHLKGYREYKQAKGLFDYGNFRISIDYVQGDPFAASSLVRVYADQNFLKHDSWYFEQEDRLVALRDFICRQFFEVSSRKSKLRGSGNSGLISIDRPGQEVLNRSAVMFHESRDIEVRFTVGLPADGRKILGDVAEDIFRNDLPAIVQQALPSSALNSKDLRRHAEVNEDATFLRNSLETNGLVAFVADKSLLPRKSGVSDEPLESSLCKTSSAPQSMSVVLNCPHAGELRGLGFRKGVTLITGGGFHGKSTLLKAIEQGVYNHIPDDGREYVVTSGDAVKIRAEDGRSVYSANISPFISNLPNGSDTSRFSTNNASGSTSQATNIVEALEVGAKTLLIDEDTSATNFMVRDRRMQELVHDKEEPITPLIDRFQALRDTRDLSLIAVIGGNGDYLDLADQVIGMRQYEPLDYTKKAKEICGKIPSQRINSASDSLCLEFGRNIPLTKLDPRLRNRPVSIKLRDQKELQYGPQSIDVSLCEQFVHRSQLHAIGWAMSTLFRLDMESVSLKEAVERIERLVAEKGLKSLSEEPLGNLVEFRRYELVQTISRLRVLSEV